MAKIAIELDKCVDLIKNVKCPYAGEILTKGYGYAVNYVCTLKDNEITSGYVEWEKDINPVPDWCPVLVK